MFFASTRPNWAEMGSLPDWFESESRREILPRLSVMKSRLPNRYACPGRKAKSSVLETNPIALVGEKLDATPTWRANCRNNISAILKSCGYQPGKVDGLVDKRFIQVQALSTRSNTLLLSECIIDRIIWGKSYAPRGTRTLPYIGGGVRIIRYSPYS